MVDTDPNGPEHDGTTTGTSWLASSADSVGVARSGVMQFTAANASQVTVQGETNFDGNAGTIMFWMRSAGVVNATSNSAALFTRSAKDGLVIVQNVNGTIQAEPTNAAGVLQPSPNVSDNHWHHVAVTFDQNADTMAFYVDGVAIASNSLVPSWGWDVGQAIALGASPGWQSYNGLLDDVRYYNVALADADVLSVFNTGAVVNPGRPDPAD